jgi:hypothetical protein
MWEVVFVGLGGVVDLGHAAQLHAGFMQLLSLHNSTRIVQYLFYFTSADNNNVSS